MPNRAWPQLAPHISKMIPMEVWPRHCKPSHDKAILRMPELSLKILPKLPYWVDLPVESCCCAWPWKRFVNTHNTSTLPCKQRMEVGAFTNALAFNELVPFVGMEPISLPRACNPTLWPFLPWIRPFKATRHYRHYGSCGERNKCEGWDPTQDR
jgi:hypothetical protein